MTFSQEAHPAALGHLLAVSQPLSPSTVLGSSARLAHLWAEGAGWQSPSLPNDP